jgi:histidinol dehydrogenase
MEWLGVAEILVTVIGIAAGFAYRTLKEGDATIKEEISSRVDKLEENLKEADKDNSADLGRRIDKLEENSRRDDETVKDLIKDAEGRMREEITARIKNIVDLHSKIEKSNEVLTNKHESILDRVSKTEGIIEGKFEK